MKNLFGEFDQILYNILLIKLRALRSQWCNSEEGRFKNDINDLETLKTNSK